MINELSALVFVVIMFMPVFITWIVFTISGNIKQHAPLDLSQFTPTNDVFDTICKRLVVDEYRRVGRPTLTQRGQYRVGYLRDVSERMDKITPVFCHNGVWNDAFCLWVKQNYPNAEVRDFSNIALEFLSHTEDIQQQQLNSFVRKSSDITPAEFFAIRKVQTGDVVGVYALYNCTNGMYYVGQAKKVFSRIHQHFTGHGNGDVYADYKYGDSFTIKIIKPYFWSDS